jgi:hypothetical protein
MSDRREPILKPVAITDLHPTQISVGMREVAERRGRWQAKRGKKVGGYLCTHMIPVIGGPRDRHYNPCRRTDASSHGSNRPTTNLRRGFC